MEEVLNESETISIISKFYDDCLRFWDKEVNERKFKSEFSIEELALKDIENLKHNPYTPNGKKLNIEVKEEWIKSIKEKL